MKIVGTMAKAVAQKRPLRRHYSAELKAQVVQECRRSGASVAWVALSHGINANIAHRSRIAGRKAVTVGNEFGVVRQLCLYRRRRDPSSYVPEHAMAPVKDAIFLRHIFTHEEVRRILAAAVQHPGRNIRGLTLHTLILVPSPPMPSAPASMPSCPTTR